MAGGGLTLYAMPAETVCFAAPEAAELRLMIADGCGLTVSAAVERSQSGGRAEVD